MALQDRAQTGHTIRLTISADGFTFGLLVVGRGLALREEPGPTQQDECF